MINPAVSLKLLPWVTVGRVAICVLIVARGIAVVAEIARLCDIVVVPVGSDLPEW